MSKIRCFSDASASRCAEGYAESTVYHFTKNKFHRRCFDNNLENIFRANILENATGQMLLVVVLIVGLSLFTDLNFKWRNLIKMMQSLLGIRKIF